MRIRALIVDDEPLARERVRFFLTDEADVDILGECENGREAVEAIGTLRPDLVFLDIQMPTLNGFEVLRALDSGIHPQVIFTTAYDQFALRAFAIHALDYLLKPFDRERFQAAMQHSRAALQHADLREMNVKLSTLLADVQPPPRPYLTRFSVEEGERTLFLKADEVECIEATGNYMHLYRGAKSCIIRETLSALESRLDPARFIRTHRSWILNLDRVKELHHFHKGSYQVLMQGGMKVPVSPTFRGRLEEALKGTA